MLEGFFEGVSVAVKVIKTTSKTEVEAFVDEAYAHADTVNLSGIVTFKGKPCPLLMSDCSTLCVMIRGLQCRPVAQGPWRVGDPPGVDAPEPLQMDVRHALLSLDLKYSAQFCQMVIVMSACRAPHSAPTDCGPTDFMVLHMLERIACCLQVSHLAHCA